MHSRSNVDLSYIAEIIRSKFDSELKVKKHDVASLSNRPIILSNISGGIIPAVWSVSFLTNSVENL